MDTTDPLPTKPAVFQEFADRFLEWVNIADLKRKPELYRSGWRLLKVDICCDVERRPDHRRLRRTVEVSWLAANAACALRTLPGMLHKAEEWKMIGHAPKIKMMKEHGRKFLLGDEATGTNQ
jgi:hypothetical protein